MNAVGSLGSVPMFRRLLVVVLSVILLTLTVAQVRSLKVGFLLGTPYAFWESASLKGIDFSICQLLARELNMNLEAYVLPFTALDPVILPKLGLDLVAGGIHLTYSPH